MKHSPTCWAALAALGLLLQLAGGCRAGEPAHEADAPVITQPAQPPQPDLARRELDEGLAAISAGEYRRGLGLCEQALLHAGDDDLRAQAYRWLIHGAAQDRDPERALTYFEPAIALLPDDAWVRYSQGVALGTVGRFEEAIEALGEALRLDPTQVKALQWRAQYQYETLEYAGAIEDCTRMLEVLEQTSDAALAGWGGNRGALVRDTLEIRAGCYDASGQQDLARQDRERRLLNDD